MPSMHLPPRVDAHAHVFASWLEPAPQRRYFPRYDATPAAYLAHLDAQGFTHGVLVQPSFLGTDNGYLLAALATAPTRLRGIAVVQADTAADELDRLAAAGVVGLRLNLIGVAHPPLDEAPWRLLRRRAADRGFQIEVQSEARHLPDVLPPLLDAGGTVVIDHFGLPDPDLGIDDPRWRAMLVAAADEPRLRLKLSAPYRLGPRGPAIAAAAAPLLREAFGAERLVPGSDWPHTQHEEAARGRDFLHEFATWIPADGERAASFEAAATLFDFEPATR